MTDTVRNPPALRLLAAVVLAAAASGCSLFTQQHMSLAPQEVKVEPGGPVPARVKQRFDHAVSLMQAGKTDQAEIEFRDVVLLTPQLPAPVVDLSILYRKDGKLEEAEELLRNSALVSDNAMVWTELGVTQRLRGEFRDAQASYEKAIAADPKYAPAYRDLGVVADLYLGDAPRALTAFEKYKELSGEDKPVSNWIAELRVRTGQPAGKPAAAPDAGQKPAPQTAADAPPPKAGADAAAGQKASEDKGDQDKAGQAAGQDKPPAAASASDPPPPKVGKKKARKPAPPGASDPPASKADKRQAPQSESDPPKAGAGAPN